MIKNRLNVTMGATIVRLREKQNLTSHQLAVASGIPITTLARVERGSRAVRAAELLALKVALRVRIADLYADLQGVSGNT
jgi:transcriptional regulator with XRE-family HTH domain